VLISLLYLSICCCACCCYTLLVIGYYLVIHLIYVESAVKLLFLFGLCHPTVRGLLWDHLNLISLPVFPTSGLSQIIVAFCIMKITLLSIGKTDDAYIKEGIDKYLKRLKHYTKLELVDLPELKNTKALTQDQQKPKKPNCYEKNCPNRFCDFAG
jgi:hypothetical protein